MLRDHSHIEIAVFDSRSPTNTEGCKSMFQFGGLFWLFCQELAIFELCSYE